MEQKIAIKLAGGIILPLNKRKEDIGYSLSFISNLMAHGYMPDKKLSNALSELSVTDITSLSEAVMPVLKELVGANVVHKPMYPNFPKQVMEADAAELFRVAQAHYFTKGKWMPEFHLNDRPLAYENVNFKTLSIVDGHDMDQVFTNILQSADSISEFNKSVLAWFIANRTFVIPEKIPFKENVCVVAGLLLDADMWNSTLVKDTTDILRIVTFINGGDISLAENTKFKSLPRRVREEDFARHSNKWIKLFHNLHVGDYSSSLYQIAKKLRENKKITTFNGRLEALLSIPDVKDCITLLQQRPGIFARKILELISKDPTDKKGIVDAFSSVVDDVPARNLTQLLGAVKVRGGVVQKRVVFPKGLVQHAYVLRNELARLNPAVRTHLNDVVTASLKKRFSSLDALGKVYIDPALYECPLPVGMRSASEGLREVARGTRMPIGNKGTLRLFVYWKGEDIDLSATFHDENFNQVYTVSYSNLNARHFDAVHSGDIVSAPNGASEFVDVDIKSVLDAAYDIRYVAMHVMVFTGPAFKEHDVCFAGWMTRDKTNSNAIYHPKTVEQKIDIRGATKNVIPVIFDLKKRKAIWTDISTNGKGFSTDGNKTPSGNNVENNKATIEDMVEAFTSLDNKITLGELFEMHGQARGNLVTDRKDADFIFAMDDADVTPYDIIDINANFL